MLVTHWNVAFIILLPVHWPRFASILLFVHVTPPLRLRLGVWVSPIPAESALTYLSFYLPCPLSLHPLLFRSCGSLFCPASFFSLSLSPSPCVYLFRSFSVTLIISISRLIRCTALPSLLDRPVRIDLSTGTTFLDLPRPLRPSVPHTFPDSLLNPALFMCSPLLVGFSYFAFRVSFRVAVGS